MGRVIAATLLAVSMVPAMAYAGNTDEVNAGLDVTLTGGAVVATTYTGAALWYNPAGIARIDKPSVELTGITLNIQVIKNPGLITIDSVPQGKSEGTGVNFSVIPQAITFTLNPKKENLKIGVGLFNSSVRREFITEQAASSAGTTPQVNAYSARNTRLDFFHVSAGFAGRFAQTRKQKALFGGALDFVVASSRADESYSALYDFGKAGQISSASVGTQTGFGIQPKLGIQWVPLTQLRIGLSVTAPTYLFAVLERFSSSFSQAPPEGTIPTDPNLRQQANGAEGRGARSVWWAVEPGNLRYGMAYVGKWGWIEADLIYYFRLREAEIGLNLRGFLNGRLGSSFRVSENVKLGLGLLTDFSQVDNLERLPLATRKIDFYGIHLGILYSTQEVHPDRKSSADDGLDLSVAVGLRYSHGRGDTLGLLLPTQYDPGAVQFVPVATKVNEIAINLAAKVGF